jgi:hypothetical protein
MPNNTLRQRNRPNKTASRLWGRVPAAKTAIDTQEEVHLPKTGTKRP